MMSDYAAARRTMIDSQLRPQGVTDPGVLTAMASLPREDFVPAAARAFAYSDRAIPVAGGEMMASAILAKLLTAAAPVPGERALIVGAAPAYAAAILRSIGLEAIEQAATAMSASAASGGFDLIVIEGAVSKVPKTLVDALNPNGRIVTALLVDGGVTRLAIGRKSAGVLGLTSFADGEVAPLAGYASSPVFTF